MITAVKTRKRIFYGWWVVAAVFVIAMLQSGTFFYGFGAFFNPIQQEFGWSYGLLSLVFSLRSIEAGIVAPIIGMGTDRLGTRKILVFGTVVFALGMFTMAAINSIIAFYAAYLFIALGQSCLFGIVPSAAVINWFQRKRGLALGIFLAGGGVGGLMVPPITLLIDVIGWRGAMATLGAVSLALGLPLALMVRNRPEDYGYLPDGDEPGVVSAPAPGAGGRPGLARGGRGVGVASSGDFTLAEVLRLKTFWLLTAAMVLSGVGTQVVSVHHIPYLRSVGFTPALAALSVSAMAIISVPGRPVLGFVADKSDKRLLTAGLMAGQGLGILIFAFATEFWHLIPFFFTFGIAFGGLITMRPALQSDYFGRKAFGSIQGVMMTVTTAGGVVSPVLAGVVYDLVGSYRPAFLFLGVLALLATPLMLMARRPRRPQLPTPPP